MYLSSADIENELEGHTPDNAVGAEDRLIIEPLQRPIQPASVDIHVGQHVIIPVGGTINYQHGLRPEYVALPIGSALILTPEQFVNIDIAEYLEIPRHLVARVEGKSMLARDGLQVESAGYVDPGYHGRLTLELKNLGPHLLVLHPGDPIGQLRFAYLQTPPRQGYGHPQYRSHYQHAETVEVGVPERVRARAARTPSGDAGADAGPDAQPAQCSPDR